MEEMVIWVDESNRELGVVPRSQMRRQRLAHRASFIFVFRPSGLLLAQRRTLTKDLWPGRLDLAAGGVVTAGETYLESARRELAEELGIVGAPLDRHFDFWFDHPDARAWGRVYSCRWDGAVRAQPEEVAAVEEIAVEDALAGKYVETATPDSLAALERLARDFLMQRHSDPISPE
jgi:8-oxo-dGTP pyrophosphatase MutT (NUDIX family)